MVLVGRSFLSALLPCSEEALGAGLPHSEKTDRQTDRLSDRQSDDWISLCCRSAEGKEEECKHEEVNESQPAPQTHMHAPAAAPKLL